MPHVSNVGVEILRVLCGSRAYGLNGPDSDWDYHGVFVVPTRTLLSIGGNIKESKPSIENNIDNTVWEVQHFLELALGCNPTVLETFVAPREGDDLDNLDYSVPEYEWDAWNHGTELRKLFPYVLSRKKVFDAYRGYAKSQLNKIDEIDIKRSRKAAIAYLRTLYHGTLLLSTGTYETEIKTYLRDYLLELRNAKRFPSEFYMMAKEWEMNIEDAYNDSSIQEGPNIEPVNEFLLEIRKEYW